MEQHQPASRKGERRRWQDDGRREGPKKRAVFFFWIGELKEAEDSGSSGCAIQEAFLERVGGPSFQHPQ